MTGANQERDPITLRYQAIPKPLYWKAAQAACRVRSKKPVHHFLWMAAGWVLVFLIVFAANRFPMIAQNGPAFLVGMTVMWVGLMIIGRLQRFKMNEVLEDEQSRRGPVDMTIGAEGCVFKSDFGVSELNWTAIDQIVDLGAGIGLRSGLMVYPIPTSSLPTGLSQQEFLRILQGWAGHR